MQNTKRFAAVLACLLAVALLFTACSGKPKNIEAYLKNETVAKQLDEQLGSMSSDEFTVEIAGEGNTLIYTFTFGEAIDLSDETIKAAIVSALESGMEQQRSVFEGLADQIRAQVQGDDVAIRVVYSNADGSEIYAATFA